jgi:putative DNA primase/helicase
MTAPPYDRDEVRAALNARASTVGARLLGEPNRVLSNGHELRWGTKGSFSLKISGDKVGMWFDHEGQGGGDLLDLIARERGCDFPSALAFGADLVGIKPRAPNGKGHYPNPRPPIIAPEPEPKHIAATPTEARTVPATLPLWTPPDEHSRPKFIGDPAIPPKYGSEMRRHVYMRSDVPVQIKIKQKTAPAWLPYYRVRNAHGTLGWQAKKPIDYRAVPYVGAVDPFDPALADDRIYWTEGEKDADTLGKINAPAFTFGGVGDGLPAGAEQFVVGRHVVILSHNDPQARDQKGALRFHPDGRPVMPGQDHAERKAELCYLVTASVRVVHFPELLEKGDVSDWIAQGHGLEELESRVDAAPLWQPRGSAAGPAPLPPITADAAALTAPTEQPPAPDQTEIEIARLAGLKLIDYERDRIAAAERLGIRVTILDKLVEAARPRSATPQGQGRALSLPEPAPWSSPVDGANLLTDLSDLIRRHVVMSRAAADAAGLWVVHTHAFEAAQIAPRLLIKSPEKQCGKSTLLHVLQHLAYRPLPTSNITAAALFRMIEVARPTLLIDEADTFLPANEEMRGIINSGHTQASAHVTRTVGDDFEPRQFSTWASMAVAAIGKLPGTIEDRGISLQLRRKRRDERVEPLRRKRVGHLQDGASRASRWVKDNIAAIAEMDPECPDELHGRAADNWEPLFAIADRAGGDWPARARSAALELSADSAADRDSIGTMLLGDIRAEFEAKGVDRFSGDDLTAHLIGLEDRPWPEFNKGKPLTKATLARQLGKFKILSGTIRLPDGRTPRGYYLASFDDAFARYLPPKSATVPQPHSHGHRGTFQSATEVSDVAVSKVPQPYSHGHCGTVAHLEGEAGERGQ